LRLGEAFLADLRLGEAFLALLRIGEELDVEVLEAGLGLLRLGEAFLADLRLGEAILAPPIRLEIKFSIIVFV
jgi:hypothetical protein